MYNNIVYILASFLFKYFFPIYKRLYFLYKYKKDRYELKLFYKWISPGQVIVDIGANIGFYSVFFSKLTGNNGRVYSFEPDKLNYKHLEKITKTYNNIETINLALSEKQETIKLYVSHRLNVDHRTYKPEKFKNSYEIEATSLDNYLNQKTPDVIKMDIQGAEFSALKGMKNTLSNNPDIILLMEYWPEVNRKQGIEINDIIDYVKQLNKNIYVIKNDKVVQLNDSIIQGYKRYKKDAYSNWIITGKHLNDFVF